MKMVDVSFSEFRKKKHWIPNISLIALLVLIGAILWPVNNGVTRWLIAWGMTGTLIGCVWGMIGLWRWKRGWFYALTATLGAGVGLAFGAFRSFHSNARLDETYLRELRNALLLGWREPMGD